MAAMGRGGWGRGFGPDGPFGPEGPFGPNGPFGPDGPFGRGGGGRGGRRGRMFGSGELRLVLLKLIADEPRHGYDLIRAIEELTHGDYAPSPGVIYPTLSLLSDEGLIEEQPGEGARKRFAATAAGRAQLEENGEDVERLFERLEETGSHRRERNRPELHRAVKNLMSAWNNRVKRDGWSEELLEQIVDIIDEAAKKIERLK
ncbi:hypothetical protein GCM10022281_01090 [Sphingomonas rosea]|uniref:Transcription regulator PadR N-terminal domain-containing protein n=2 Tax=Sphingomonas rosea TaxID=335605 RepID=A0ABP7TIZ6_9SPHN